MNELHFLSLPRHFVDFGPDFLGMLVFLKIQLDQTRMRFSCKALSKNELGSPTL